MVVAPEAPSTPEPQRVRLLTVGDGDLSFSLALLRCYSLEQIDVTISTPSSSFDHLLAQYPSARDPVHALDALYAAYYDQHPTELRRPHILYGIDAGALHTPETRARFPARSSEPPSQTPSLFDLVLFQYPHVGIDTAVSEATVRDRNTALLHRYLSSAAHLATAVHVTLHPSQRRSWQLDLCATVTHVVPVQRPLHHLFPPIRDWRIHPPTKAKSTRGSQHQRHFLAPYGYRHVRTIQATKAAERISLTGSCHYRLQVVSTVDPPPVPPEWEEPSIRETELHECPEHGAVVRDDTTERRSRMPMTARPTETPPEEHDADAEEIDDEEAPPEEIDDDEDTESRPSRDATPTETLEYSVTAAHVGMRLRAFLQQVGSHSSKRHWERSIRRGAVAIDAAVVTDSSRRLTEADRVVTTRMPLDRAMAPRFPTILLPATWTIAHDSTTTTTLWVAWKPVGMRTRGHFAVTLEQCLAQQLCQVALQSRSNLDKGCSGLCVLQLPSPVNRSLAVRHTFTALVYGHGPPEWQRGISIVLPVDGVRRWKRPRRTEPSDSDQEDEGDDHPVDPVVTEEDHTALLTLVEQTTTVPYLSTLTLSTTSRRSGLGQTIAYYLRRQQQLPVVGDRMAAQEYQALPRAMRNRLKQRWCLGCTGVALLVGDEEDQEYSHQAPVPEQWSAHYWQDFGQQSTNRVSDKEVSKHI